MRHLLLVLLAAATPALAQSKMQTAAGEAPGPWLFGTIGAGKGPDGKPLTTALKGLALRLGDGEAGICYDLELCRVAGVWTGGKFVTPMNLMSRGEYPTALGKEFFPNAQMPGFLAAEPKAPLVDWTDTRPQQFGPLPPNEVQYKGAYLTSEHPVLKWEVRGVEILETPLAWKTETGVTLIGRVVQIGPSAEDILVAAPVLSRLPEQRPVGAKSHLKDERFRQFRWDSAAVQLRCGNGHQLDELRRIASLPDDNPEKIKLRRDAQIAMQEVGDVYAREHETTLVVLNGAIYARVPPSRCATTHVLATTLDGSTPSREQFGPPWNLSEPAAYTAGGRSGVQTVTSRGGGGPNPAEYVVETIPLPDPNPWNAPMFIGGFDFFPDGRAAISTFHGDVFIVSGIDEKLEKVTWRRFASGLYHPLGLKIVNGEIYVTERSGITRLKDVNGDGEADLYEPFNWDVQVTKSFHEFAFDLQTDAQGNFYFAKAGPVKNGGRGFDEIAAHHGTLLRVTPDGKNLDVVATGFRAPNGIGVGPRGELTSGDNEGTWVPTCKINWIKPGGFYGVVDLAHRTPPPSDYDRPLCWLPKRVDNSGGGQVWVPEGERWGPWGGQLLHLSYGHCSLFGVMREEAAGVIQGGVTKFPLKFESGIMRARFNPVDGQLYVAGLRGWQTDGTKNGCLQRVRYTGAPVRMPMELHARKNGIEIKFTCSLDTQSAADPENWNVEVWNYIWSSAYGSPEVSTRVPTDKPAEPGKDGVAQFTKAQMSGSKHDSLTVKSVSIGTDDRTVFLEIPGLSPVMQMAIKYGIKAGDGVELKGEVVNTIHALAEN